jgi:hypothetical protein
MSVSSGHRNNATALSLHVQRVSQEDLKMRKKTEPEQKKGGNRQDTMPKQRSSAPPRSPERKERSIPKGRIRQGRARS